MNHIQMDENIDPLNNHDADFSNRNSCEVDAHGQDTTCGRSITNDSSE